MIDPQKFVSLMKSTVVEENAQLYRDTFENTNSASDTYWKQALSFYQNLDPGSKEILFNIIQQVSIDTVSNVLGILDGGVLVDEDCPELVLYSSDDRTNQLNGDLQDLFLSQFE